MERMQEDLEEQVASILAERIELQIQNETLESGMETLERELGRIKEVLEPKKNGKRKAPFLEGFLKELEGDGRLQDLLQRMMNGRAKRGTSKKSLQMRYEDASYLVKRILRDDLFRLVEHVCNEVMKQNKANEDILDSPQSQLKLFQKARLRDWQVEVQYQY
jgi:hypothetical protein